MKKLALFITSLLTVLLTLSLASCSCITPSDTDNKVAVPSTIQTERTASTDGETDENEQYVDNSEEQNSIDSLGYVVVTKYVVSDGSEDVTEALQTLIDNNPHRTIYFPDGIYLLSSPLLTSANPAKSVHFVLSNYATLTASDDWSGGALISLGGGESFNNVTQCGSNYGIDGGIFDCRGKADGIEIASGRETYLRNISIKNSVVGIHILYGANSGSSDADITNCNIIGNNALNSIGIQIDGYDNTITNVRIGHCQTGVLLNGGGNMLTYIHPLFNMDYYENYNQSVAFLDKACNNVYYFCYSDQYCIGFKTTSKSINTYNDCWAHWYTASGGKETAFCATDAFNSIIIRPTINFSQGTTNTVLSYNKSKNGNGYIQDIISDKTRFTNNDYESFLRGSVIYK